MLVAVVATAALLGWILDDRPEDLVARLGSPRFAEREAAAAALKRLGRPALPALRKAQSGQDPEIRLRAAKVRDEIEASLLLEATSPTRSRDGPFRVELLRIRRERDLGLAPGLSRFGRGPLVSGPPSGVAGPGYGPEVNDLRTSSFFAELCISTEPRLRIVGEATLERLKAIDDRGHSVLREPTAEERKAQADRLRMNPHLDRRLHPEWRFGSGGRQSSPSQLLRIPLADSTPPGGRLRELGGVIAVAVMGRRPDPLVIPLKDGRERTIENDGVRVTVHEAVVPPSHFFGELELTLETERPAETLTVQGPGIAPVQINRPLDLIEREIEIVDDKDQPLDWSFLRPPPGGLRGRMRLQVRPRNHLERLNFSGLRLRVTTMIGAAIEIPFSFTDVPTP